MSLINFKAVIANTPTNTYKALPANRYNFVVEKAEVQPTKSGGEMIVATFIVTNGKFKNRKCWHRFTLGEKSLPFLVTFIQKAGLPDILNKEDIDSKEVAMLLEDVRISAYTEPSKTPDGKDVNVLKNWEQPIPADDEDLPDFLKEDIPIAKEDNMFA